MTFNRWLNLYSRCEYRIRLMSLALQHFYFHFSCSWVTFFYCVCQRCWQEIFALGESIPFMSAVRTWGSTGGWPILTVWECPRWGQEVQPVVDQYSRCEYKKVTIVTWNSTGGWEGTHGVSPNSWHTCHVMFHAYLHEHRVIRRWLECTRWGTNSCASFCTNYGWVHP